jgi:ribonuclease HII
MGESKKNTWLIGVDEAGRGPLAGPVAVGIFAIPSFSNTEVFLGVCDSKKLSPKQRAMHYQTLTKHPHTKFAVSMVSASHIDEHGIQNAIRFALSKSLTKLSLDPELCTVLLDGGLTAPTEYRNQQTIIKGDATELCISSASILAKVTRDRHMLEQARRFPAYGFEAHKGYGTRAHCIAIQTYGLSPIHRVTFCRNIIRESL